MAANGTAAGRFGREVTDFVGRPILDLTDPEVRDSRRLHYQRALDGGVTIAFRDIRAGRVYDNILCPLPPVAGSGPRLAIYARDITEELAAQDVVHEGRERLAKILRLTPAVIAISTQAEGRLLEVNEAFCDLTGLSRQDSIGRTYDELGLFIDKHDNARIADTLAREGVVRNMEVTVRHRGGRGGTGLLSCIPLTAYGQPCVLSVMMDITGRKTMEQALRLAKDEAETASQTQVRFLATVSHEIRTPMNTILGMVDMLRESGLSPGQERFLAALEQAGEGLLGLFSDILDVARAHSGQLHLSRETYAPRALARQAVDAQRGRAASKGLSLSLALTQDAPETALGDPSRVAQVLGNLLDNAITFTPAGSVCLAVARHAETGRQERLVFSVTDTGIGIPPEQHRAIFEPFTRGEDATVRANAGLGLGLALSAMLARSMGGRLSCTSQPGQGSMFCLILPLHPPRLSSPARPAGAGTSA